MFYPPPPWFRVSSRGSLTSGLLARPRRFGSRGLRGFGLVARLERAGAPWLGAQVPWLLRVNPLLEGNIAKLEGSK